MSRPGAKRVLLRLLDEYAFDPIFSMRESKYTSEAQRRLLKEIKQTTARIQHLYYREPTAEDVYRSFKHGLNTIDSRRFNQKLNELRLPTLEDIKYRVEQTAKSLELETQ